MVVLLVHPLSFIKIHPSNLAADLFLHFRSIVSLLFVRTLTIYVDFVEKTEILGLRILLFYQISALRQKNLARFISGPPSQGAA